MRGEITTWQRCPKCKGKFHRVHLSTTSTILTCKACKTHPTRYRLDIYHKGERHRISREEDGTLLGCVDRTNALLSEIRRAKRFDPTRYVKRKKEPYLLGNVCTRWIAHAETTLNRARGTIKLKEYYKDKFIAHFGSVDIREIQTLHVREFGRTLIGFEGHYRNNIMRQLKNLFRFARDEFSDYTDIPKCELVQVQNKEVEAISEELQIAILNALPEKHQPIFRFLALTGVRTSMARALQWQDIKWSEDMIVFSRNFSAGVLGPLKTHRILKFPLYPPIDRLLKSLPRSITGFVFINPTTKRYYGHHLDKWLYETCDKLGVPRIRVKNFTRHTFATELLDAGVSIRDVADLLGHSSTNITKNTYSQVKIRRLGQILEMKGMGG